MDGGELEVDDLFGDSGGLVDASLDAALAGTSLDPIHPIHVPVRGLAQRVDDLHLSGCRQKIAWSRLGGIAYITPDGSEVKFRCLKFHAATVNWDLSKEYPVVQRALSGESHPFVHLEWSQTGMDLGVADSVGRISVFTFSSTAINLSTAAPILNVDQQNELDRAVGMFWLNLDRQIMMVFQASKENDRWIHLNTRRKPLGPYWPRALAFVTRSGSFRVTYQKPDGIWSTAKVDLRSLLSTGSLITHAAIAPTHENKLLVATQTFDRKMFVYLVQVSWPDMKREPGTDLIPYLEVEHVKGFVPTGNVNISDTNGMVENPSMYDTSDLGLSHLEIIATSDVDKAVRLPPMIIAVYTSTVNSLGTSPSGHPLSSTISRWNVASTERKLHPRFNEIVSNVGATTLPPKTDLHRLPDIHINQIITSLHQVDRGSAIAVSTQDGSTAFYNPSTMTQLYMETTINEVTSMMSQPGFTFPINPTALQTAFSPTGCASVSLNPDGKVELSSMEYHSGLDVGNASHISDPGLDATFASINLAFTRACYSTSTGDDILYCILRSFRPEQHHLLMSSMYRSLFKDSDLIAGPGPGSDIDKLPRNQMVAKVLSLQSALGYTPVSTDRTSNPNNPVPPKRNLSSAFAWMTLNIRYVAVNVYIALSTAKGTSSEYAEPDILDVICNNIRWSLDLFKLIVDDLFEIAEAAERLNQQREKGNNTGANNINGTIGQETYPESTTPLTRILVTSLWSRFFLQTISRCFRGILTVPKSPHHQSLDAVSLQAFGRMAQTIESGGLPLEAFERLLGGADKLVRAAYQESGYGDKERADTEREILASGRVEGTVLNGVVGRLCEDVLPVSRGEVDRLGLFVGDYGWVLLELGPARMGLGSSADDDDAEGNGVWVLLGRKTNEDLMDVHRKKAVKGRPDREVRRCVRCGCVNVDVAGPPRSWPKSSHQQVMRCVCESGFVIEKLGVV